MGGIQQAEVGSQQRQIAMKVTVTQRAEARPLGGQTSILSYQLAWSCATGKNTSEIVCDQ